MDVCWMLDVGEPEVLDEVVSKRGANGRNNKLG